jgi:hypothetical protein
MTKRAIVGSLGSLFLLAGCDSILGLQHRELYQPDGGGGVGGAASSSSSTSTGGSGGSGGHDGAGGNAPTCTDSTKNGDETGIDCGGSCPKCAPGGGCISGADCQSGVCQAKLCLDNYPWSEAFGSAGTSLALVFGAATDTANNVVLTGTYSGTLDLGGGVLTAKGTNDVFLAKFDAQGTPVWSFGYGGVNGADTGYAVATDTAGNVYFTGEFNKGIDFGVGCALTSTSTRSVFVVKLDSFGAPKWCKNYGLTGTHSARAIALDPSGNVFVGGQLGGKSSSTINFGGGVLTDTGSGDAFVAKLDAAGNYVWAKNWGDDSQQFVNRLAVDSGGNVLLSGIFQSQINFGGNTFTNTGGLDSFLVKLSPAGAHLWSQPLGGTKDQVPSGLAVTPTGNVVLGGAFQDSIDCSGNPQMSAGATDIFLCEFDPSGAPKWSKTYGDASAQDGPLVAADSAGNIILTASGAGSVNFGGAMLTSAGGPNGGQDIFVAKLDPAGAHIWSQRFGDAQVQTNGALALDHNDAVLLSGGFNGAMTFGAKKLTSVSVSGDIFLAKLVLP